jgi:hypothetical protein
MEYQMNLRKLGVMIHRYRIARLNSPQGDDFRQEKFLNCSSDHPFFDVQAGFPVCSRGTMLRLENGKNIREEELYRFFLGKLGLVYAYSPLREQQFRDCFNAFDAIVTEGTLRQLDHLALPAGPSGNVLYDFYDRLLLALYRFYTLALFPSVEMMDEIGELWFCVPETIRPLAKILILSAYSAHPFYDQIDLHPIIRKFPSHPLEILACTFATVAKERFLLSGRLMDRYEGIGCKGELPGLLQALIQSFTTTILRHTSHPVFVAMPDTSHPLTRLYLETLVFHLGKHAVEHDDFPKARDYFDWLGNCGEPFGIFSALIMDHPYTGALPANPRLLRLTGSMAELSTATKEQRLAILMLRILPNLSERERFISIFLRIEIIALVHNTQRYKSAYTYLSRFDALRKA